MILKKTFKTALFALTAGILFCGADAIGQEMPAFFKKNNAKKNRSDIPTIIESATMDVDMENNKAILIGNVVVDDASMKIVCNKMIIYLEDKEEVPETAAKKDEKVEKAPAAKQDIKDAKKEKESGKKKEAKKNDGKKTESQDDTFSSSGKELKKVECYGDVVITNKADPDDPDAKDQVATSDFALYDLKTNTVTLTGKPVLTSGADRLNCEKIVFDLETGRTKIMNGRIISYGDHQNKKKK